jgi:putative ABC transport system permease protein
MKHFLFTIRGLLHRPSFTLVVLITLMFGIGASVAIFTLVDSVLLRPLAFASPDRLVLIPSLNQDGTGKIEEYGSSIHDFLEWRNRSKSFSSLIAMQPTEVAITGAGEPEQLEAGLITANLFDVLGVHPVAGRFFVTQEEVANATVVILSQGLWKRRFGENVSALGQTIIVDGIARQIVGIAPSNFFFSAPSELWLPQNLTKGNPLAIARFMTVAGRLRDGVSIEQASSEMQTIAGQMSKEFAGNAGWSAKVIPIREPFVRDIKNILYFLSGAVGFFLVIVCMNVANIVLVRNMEQQNDMILRLALGGTRNHLLRHALVENSVLTVLGGLLGVALAAISLKPLIALSPVIASSPSGNRILSSVHIDIRVVLFALALSIIVALALSIVPTLRISRLNLAEALKRAGSRTTGSVYERKFQKGFAIAQIAVSFLLFIGTALMLQTFVRLQNVSPGFNPDSLLTARITLPQTQYDTHQKRAEFQKLLLERAQAIPGVVSASMTTRLPLNEFSMTTLFEVDGVPTPEGGFVANFRRIGPDYFKTLQTRILEGREFTTVDGENAIPAVVISREMANRLWPGKSPIGKRIRRLARLDPDWKTIVGVVEDLKDSSLVGSVGMTFYMPYRQGSIPPIHVVIRSSNPANAAVELRRTVRQMNPDLPLYQLTTGKELVMNSLSRQRFTLYLLGIFAMLGMIVALVGVYSVISYTTASRVNEIGLRMAVGAQQRSILTLILEQSLRLTLWGLLIGLITSLFVERIVSSIWTGTAGWETYLPVAIFIAFTTLVAAILPALRATRIDPMLALRHE